MTDEIVYVIPCSGIGKATASVGRDAMYEVIEDMRPETSDTLCLSLLTMGDEETVGKTRRNKVITIEGCPKDCARKNVESCGVEPDISHRVHDFLKEHRDLKPETVLDTGEGGRQLAGIMAQQIAEEVDELLEKP
ncbi:MAG TPA: putative zinc-binding protein [Candidatus Anoxymicrobiaceae bacterium]